MWKEGRGCMDRGWGMGNGCVDGECGLGVYTHPETATEAGGMHSTGMYTCIKSAKKIPLA